MKRNIESEYKGKYYRWCTEWGDYIYEIGFPRSIICYGTRLYTKYIGCEWNTKIEEIDGEEVSEREINELKAELL